MRKVCIHKIDDNVWHNEFVVIDGVAITIFLSTEYPFLVWVNQTICVHLHAANAHTVLFIKIDLFTICHCIHWSMQSDGDLCCLSLHVCCGELWFCCNTFLLLSICAVLCDTCQCIRSFGFNSWWSHMKTDAFGRKYQRFNNQTAMTDKQRHSADCEQLKRLRCMCVCARAACIVL